MKSVIVDTNIFVSALIGSKNCRKIYELLKHDKFGLVITDDLLHEITKVLGRTKLGLNKKEINDVIWHIRRKSQKVIPKEKISICRDPKDNVVLECAGAIKVNCIVSGDKDLLELKHFRNISIISPRKFLKLFKNKA